MERSRSNNLGAKVQYEEQEATKQNAIKALKEVNETATSDTPIHSGAKSNSSPSLITLRLLALQCEFRYGYWPALPESRAHTRVIQLYLRDQ
jgi:hypothetical protein